MAPMNPKQQSAQLLYSGWLTKRGDLRKSWKQRWFVLRPKMLSYYTDDKCTKCLGTIYLERALAVGPTLEKGDIRPLCMDIVTEEGNDTPGKGRVYLLSAETEDQYNAWLTKIAGQTPFREFNLRCEGFVYRKPGSFSSWRREYAAVGSGTLFFFKNALKCRLFKRIAAHSHVYAFACKEFCNSIVDITQQCDLEQVPKEKGRGTPSEVAMELNHGSGRFRISFRDAEESKLWCGNLSKESKFSAADASTYTPAPQQSASSPSPSAAPSPTNAAASSPSPAVAAVPRQQPQQPQQQSQSPTPVYSMPMQSADVAPAPAVTPGNPGSPGRGPPPQLPQRPLPGQSKEAASAPVEEGAHDRSPPPRLDPGLGRGPPPRPAGASPQEHQERETPDAGAPPQHNFEPSESHPVPEPHQEPEEEESESEEDEADDTQREAKLQELLDASPWQEHFDPNTQRNFYHNPDSQETVWLHPFQDQA